jgi:hypothetical protein
MFLILMPLELEFMFLISHVSQTQALKTWDIKNIDSRSKVTSIKNINSSSNDMGYQEHKLKL